MVVIADTSPINYLVRIEEIDLLPALFGTQKCGSLGTVGILRAASALGLVDLIVEAEQSAASRTR
jgi:predicted nucleic acid-binding protein